MKLAYQAVDKSGAVARDSIEASSPAEASEKLRQRGLFVTEIHEIEDDHDRHAPPSVHKPRGRGGGGVKALAIWSRQLSVLVRSGTPLAPAMLAIENQVTPGPWRSTLAAVRTQVEEGTSLSEAMGRHRGTFDEVVQSLIAAGESSGQLGDMLERVSELIRQKLKVQRSILGALIYPLLLVMIGFVVTVVMLVGVLPRFGELFESLGTPLPPTTALLMSLSEVIRSYWWAMLLGVVAAGVGAYVLLSGAAGRRRFDEIVVRVPYVGNVIKSLCTARIARLMGVMLDSRVPLLQALQLTEHSTGNAQFAQLVRTAVDAATRGEQISEVFARSPLVSPTVSEAMRHGEQNGQIGPILEDMADFLDEENEVIVKTAMSMLEPLILIGLGVVVGFIALSLFIPLFDLTSTAGAQ